MTALTPSARFVPLEQTDFRRLEHAAYLKGLLQPFKGKGSLETWASQCAALRDDERVVRGFGVSGKRAERKAECGAKKRSPPRLQQHFRLLIIFICALDPAERRTLTSATYCAASPFIRPDRCDYHGEVRKKFPEKAEIRRSTETAKRVLQLKAG